MRLLPSGAQVGGDVRVQGASVYALSRKKLQEYRRRDVGMIYQDPRAHINPLRTVGDFLSEGLREAGEVRPADDVLARSASWRRSGSATRPGASANIPMSSRAGCCSGS